MLRLVEPRNAQDYIPNIIKESTKSEEDAALLLAVNITSISSGVGQGGGSRESQISDVL